MTENEISAVLAGGGMKNDIIFDTAMAEKKLENGKVRYAAAYPTSREGSRDVEVGFYYGG